MSNETVTRAVFEAEERGVAETASTLGRLVKGATEASSATDRFAKTSESSAAKIGTIERSVDQLQKRLAGAPAAWQRYERSMRVASDGLKSGQIDAESYAEAVRKIQQELQRVVAPRLDLDVANSGLSVLLGNTEKVTVATREQAREHLRLAQAKQAADAETARGQELLARETARYRAEIDSLRATYDPAFASAQKMGAELENLARLEREGIEIAGGYDGALERITLRYDENAQAAKRAADAHGDMIRRAREAQAQANASMIADANQGAYNQLLGVGNSTVSARDSAAVFEAEAQRMADMQAAAEKLRGELDPLGAAYDRMQAEIAEYQALADQQILTQDELAAATAKSREGFDRFSRGLDNSGRSSQGLLSRLSGLMTRMTPLMAIMGATGAVGGGGGLFALANSGTRIEETERAVRRLEGVLTATGAAAGMSAGEIVDFARQIEAATGRAEEEVLTVAAQLSTFTSIGQDEFERTIRLSADLAEVFGGSLQSNIDAVARALDDPIKGFQNLRQRGFALEESELRLVKAFQASGDAAAAQGVVLQNLEAQVGGAAVRAYGGLTKAQGDAKRATEQAIDAFNRESGSHAARIAATEAYGTSMRVLAENMDIVAPAATVLSAVVGSRLTTAFVTSNIAGNAFKGTLAAITTRAGAASAAMALVGGPVGLGITAVTAIATGLLLWSRNTDAANRSLEEHRELVREIEQRYRDADEARRLLTRGELEKDHRALTDDIATRTSEFEAARKALMGAAVDAEFHLSRELSGRATAVHEIMQGFVQGRLAADEFAADLLELSRTDLVAQTYLDSLRDMGVDFSVLADKVVETQGALADTNRQLGITSDRMDAVTDSTRRASDAMAAFSSNMESIRAFVPEFERLRKVQQDLDEITRLHADSLRELEEHYSASGDFEAYIEGYEKLAGNTAAARDAVTGLTDARARLAEYESGAALSAMEPRQQALAREAQAYETLRQSIADTASATGDLSDVQGELSRAQSAYEQNVARINTQFDEQDRKAQLSRRTVRRAGEEAIEQLNREISMLGQSEAAKAAAEFKAREYARALEEAREAGLSMVPPEVLAQIDTFADKIGVATGRLHELRAAEEQRKRVADTLADLDFQASLIGLSQVDQEITRTLHQLGLSYDSVYGKAVVERVRHNALLREANEELEEQRAILENVASTFLDIFDASDADNFFDRVMKGLADIGRQFAQLGKQRLIDMILPGGSYTTGQPAPGQRSVFPSGLPAAANQNVPQIAQLNTSLERTSRSALDVARQFNGLNERADSAVLDSFMQASGTWRNLSSSDTAWCAAFANAAIVQAGGQGTNSNLASSFMNWGQGTNTPQVGDIVVLKPQARGASGHVGFVAGFGDGSVQVFGGNQSNAANVKSFGMDQVSGFRTGEGLRGAVAGGFIDAQRQIVTGNAGFPAMAGTNPQALGGAFPAAPGAGGGGGFSMNGVQNFLQSPMGMGGMNALGAFGSGMQSGSPISGALTGGLGALGMGLGPVGIGIGVIGGILGGIFGRSKQKKEQRRQEEERRKQAQAQLDQQLPAILELQDTLLDRASGTLMKEKARIEGQIKQYQELAKQAKNQSEIDRLNSMADSVSFYMERLYADVRMSAESVIDSMNAGRGLDPEFATAIASVREQSMAIRNYIADLTAAIGGTVEEIKKDSTSTIGDIVGGLVGNGSSRSPATTTPIVQPEHIAAEIERVQAAGRQQLLRLLSGPEEVSEIYTQLDTLHGTAAALASELQKLGLNAEQAAAAIEQHLNKGIDRLRNDFGQNLRSEIADAQGLGYLNQLRQLIERRDEHRADAVSLGADPALVDRWFTVQARSIIDQSGLIGDALDPLITLFPELADVLGDSMAEIERTLDRAESDLRSAYNRQRSELDNSVQRLERFSEALNKYRDELLLDDQLSPLSPFEKLTEAQQQFRDIAEKAAAGDEEAQDQLIGLSRRYLDEARSYYASSEHYFAIFGEVSDILGRTEQAALDEIDTAKAQLELLETQVGALIDISENVLTVADAIDAFNAAQAARDHAQAIALQDYVRALNPEAKIPSYQPPKVEVTPAPKPTPTPETPKLTQLLWNRYGQQQSYTGSMQTYGEGLFARKVFVPDGWTIEDAMRKLSTTPFEMRDSKRFGGVIGGYRAGGKVGNGVWDRDSVAATYAGGGHIALAGGEFVTTARGVNRDTMPVLDFINRNHRLPEIRGPQPVHPDSRSNADLVSEVRALKGELRMIRQAVGIGAQATVSAVERGNGIALEQASATKRRNAA